MTQSRDDIKQRLDAISYDLKLTAKRQETISKLLALLAVHIPDVGKTEDDGVSAFDQTNAQPCLCQITFSDLKVGG